MKCGGAWTVEFAELHAIEPDQAVLRTQPEKAVMRLQNGIDSGLK